MSGNKRNRAIGIGLSVLLMVGIIPYVYANGEAPSGKSTSVPSTGSNLDVAYQFDTNNYTMPEPAAGKVPNQTIPSSYKKVAEDGELTLYLDRASMGIMIRNRRTGYVWSSIPSERELAKEQLNSDWQASVHSPLLVNYFTPDAMLTTSSFRALGGQVEDFRLIHNGFQCRLDMPSVQISVQLVVKLENGGLVVELPANGIEENGADKLASLQPYPFLGAVHEGDIPGYMFIPDGSGALIRFTNSHPLFDEPFTGQIYGDDLSIDASTSNTAANQNGGTGSSGGGASGNTVTNANSAQQVFMPVFGMVHGVGQNGFLAIVEKGMYNANIVAYPSGVSTNLNWVCAQFILRNQYFQPTSQNMGGFTTFQKNRVNEDMQVRYIFLSGQDANYVGMAKTYQAYLKEHGSLVKQTRPAASIPLHVDVLGAEMKPGLLGNKVVDMTTFQQAQSILADLEAKGIRNMVVVYRGWNAGGLTGQNPSMFPVAGSLGGEDGLAALQQYLRRQAITFYLYSDFTDAYRSVGRFNIRRDAVRDITNQIVKQPAVNPLESMNNRLANLSKYYINPGVAATIAKDAAQQWKRMGVQGVAVNQTGFNLFSDFNPNRTYTRKQSASTYEQIADLIQRATGSVSFYSPNDYLFRYAKQIFNVSMYSSQYMYETDTVPFLEIVLHGYVNYFAPFSNFDADPQEELLRMIDYGAYPSFYLTYNPSWELENTPSEDVFTSRYADWSGEIQSEYSRVNEALRRVQGATLQSRVVPGWGVVKDTYANGVTVIVNYRSTPVTVDHIPVKARDFAIEGGRQ